MKNLIGKKFGKILVLDYDGVRPKYQHYWKCKCDCGVEKVICGYHLTSGHTTSCGCYAKERRKEGTTKHDLCKTRLFKIWTHMISRCYCETDAKYYTYGARGISVCNEWKNDFKSFYNWSIKNGYDDSLTIDRIDVNGNYEPLNCKWSNPVEQSNNRTNTIYIVLNDEKIPLGILARKLNIKYATLYNALVIKNKNPEVYLKERGFI